MIDFKGSQFERDVVLWGVRWYVAYPISYRQLEKMMQERGVTVDHSSLSLGAQVHAVAGSSLPTMQTLGGCELAHGRDIYISVKSQWKYLYRAVDKAGHTVDFLLTAKRGRKAAARFLRKAINQCGTPQKITIDKSGASTTAIEGYNADNEASIELRQVKYLNNIVEQDHRAIKRITRPMLGFKSFWSAAVTLAGIELMHMIRKGQFQSEEGGLTPATQFFRWLDKVSRRSVFACSCENFATEPR